MSKEWIVGFSLGAVVGVIINVLLWSYYNECIRVEISQGDPPKVFLWNQITQEKGDEVK